MKKPFGKGKLASTDFCRESIKCFSADPSEQALHAEGFELLHVAVKVKASISHKLVLLVANVWPMLHL